MTVIMIQKQIKPVETHTGLQPLQENIGWNFEESICKVEDHEGYRVLVVGHMCLGQQVVP